MSSQQRIGRHDRGDLAQCLTTNPDGARCEPPPIRIGQAQAFPAQLAPEEAVSSIRYASASRSRRSSQAVSTINNIWIAEASITAGIYITDGDSVPRSRLSSRGTERERPTERHDVWTRRRPDTRLS